jgi:hypothetical protein
MQCNEVNLSPGHVMTYDGPLELLSQFLCSKNHIAFFAYNIESIAYCLAQVNVSSPSPMDYTLLRTNISCSSGRLSQAQAISDYVQKSKLRMDNEIPEMENKYECVRCDVSSSTTAVNHPM